MYTLRLRQKVAAAGVPLIDEDCNCGGPDCISFSRGVRAWAIFTRTDGAHGVEICLSAADIPNTTFARTSMLLMFESCNERPRCDRDCVSLRSGSGTVHLRAKSPSSPSLTPSYWSTVTILDRRGLIEESCECYQ